MRITVEIPDPVYRRLKARAASEGTTAKEMILRGVDGRYNFRSCHRRCQERSNSTMPKSTKRFLFPDSNKRLAEGCDDIRRGRVHGPFRSVPALLRSLHRIKKTKSF
jgi:hypothetical protein